MLVLVIANLLPSVLIPAGKTYLAVLLYGRKASTLAEKGWVTPTTRRAEWESRPEAQDKEDARNWAGLQRLRKEREDGSLWWDERAEQLFMSKVEKSQFPTDCSQTHWVARRDVEQGLVSTLHIFEFPQIFAIMRGHTLVEVTGANKRTAFTGCGPRTADANLMCFFNLSSCDAQDDPSRFYKIMAWPHDRDRMTWDEFLLQDDANYFSPGGVTVIQTQKGPWPPWETNRCLSSSRFSSISDAYKYHKFSLWGEMGSYGKAGVVTNSSGRMMTKELSIEPVRARQQRVDMVLTGLTGYWMLNQLHDYVKGVADRIMSRYTDESGRPLWKSPVAAVHIRQTDKAGEDPYFAEHGVYRPVEEYAERLKRMEDDFGFRWGSVFIISDSGTAMETLMKLLNPNFEPAANATTLDQEDQKPCIMYDWVADRHLVEKYEDHTRVPKELKHDMQTHFLASLYIVQKIADHALVTYSSNVGRFIGEQMAAKHRRAFLLDDGPFTTSLDGHWFWY